MATEIEDAHFPDPQVALTLREEGVTKENKSIENDIKDLVTAMKDQDQEIEAMSIGEEDVVYQSNANAEDNGHEN
jgi:hypothetical protein